jgi:hypothetical protein
MSTKENLHHLVRTSSDEALIEVLTHRENYRNDYIEAAELELRKRGVRWELVDDRYSIETGKPTEVVPKYVYIQAVVFGLIVPLTAYFLSAVLFDMALHLGTWARVLSVVILLSCFALLGFRFGYHWPTVGWKWGLWIVPGFAVLTLCHGAVSSLLLFILVGSLGAVAGRQYNLRVVDRGSHPRP